MPRPFGPIIAEVGSSPAAGDLGTFTTLALALAAGAAAGYETARSEEGAALVYADGELADLRLPLADATVATTKRVGGASASAVIGAGGLTVTPDGLTVYAVDPASLTIRPTLWLRARAALTTPGTPATDDFIGVGFRRRSDGYLAAWGVAWKSTGRWASARMLGTPGGPPLVSYSSSDSGLTTLPASLDLGCVRFAGGSSAVTGAYMGGALSADGRFPDGRLSGTEVHAALMSADEDCDLVVVLDVNEDTAQTFGDIRLSLDPEVVGL